MNGLFDWCQALESGGPDMDSSPVGGGGASMLSSAPEDAAQAARAARAAKLQQQGAADV